MESPLPGTGRDHRRRGPSEVARPQDRPSPGARRRPLPGRERRLFSPVQLRCANRHFRRTKPRRLLSLALARARERMKGEGVGRTSIHDATDPHPALGAGLSLAGRGVSLLLRREQVAAFCPLARPNRPLSAPSGAERARVRWGAQPSYCDAPRRPYMPCVQARALYERTSWARGCTGCRGGSRTAPTTRGGA